jgi:hypothetical protein
VTPEHPFEKIRKGTDYIARMGDRAAVEFEEGKVRYLLKVFHLSKAAEREIFNRAERDTGKSDLTLDAFNAVFPSFPLVLGASRLDGFQLHLEQAGLLPALFKTFGSTPFVQAFERFYETTIDAANGRSVGLVFPRKGFKNGLIVYAVDDLQQVSLMERETFMAYVSGKKKKHWLVVRSFQSTLLAVYNSGHGWRPE